uniref:Uncharacterized protein n=1 Tax=Lotus japonicus TaxID=34305 RepID=I3SEJ8_LOTJA|nr:unknown [Lotus japonicus]
MGTKIEYSINPLAYSVDCKNFTVDGVDVWEHNLKKELAYNNNQCSIGMDKLQVSMDKMLDRNNIESIKKTMQMHEEIFKHQVRELHRVYSVQKMLMGELKQHKFWTSMNNIGTNNPYVVKQQQQTTQISYGTDFHVGSLREDLHVKEGSGSCSGERNIKRQRDFDLERPAAERDIFARGCDEGEAGPSSYTAFQSCKISNDD